MLSILSVVRFVYPVPSKAVRRLELKLSDVIPVIHVFEKVGSELELRFKVARFVSHVPVNEVMRLLLSVSVVTDPYPVPTNEVSLFVLRSSVVKAVIPVPVKVVSFELENVRDVREVFQLILSESRFVSPVPVNPFEVKRLLLILRVVRLPHQLPLKEVS